MLDCETFFLFSLRAAPVVLRGAAYGVKVKGAVDI